MKLFIVIITVCFVVGCTETPKPVAQNTAPPATANRPERPQTAIAHASESEKPTQTAPSGGQSKWTQSGDPIDTAKMDAAIKAAEKALAAKPADAAAKKALADAYFDRASALTEARQYASALGDYRKTIKNDPSNAEAKQWIDQIVNIYASINRASPAEGEEPPPMEFKKK